MELFLAGLFPQQEPHFAVTELSERVQRSIFYFHSRDVFAGFSIILSVILIPAQRTFVVVSLRILFLFECTIYFHQSSCLWHDFRVII